ncbi:ABC transporter ATP-binding protein [Arthrobacter sp. AZCC_0090]|uniref:ABC transporter ATP-binding protein n=1 Tax=Arthrobacter sp. AZCC_0090 TaxID=2735881 RepID=UPI0017DCEFFB|nr:ABC transporter ATP-binding protein [Arthrobacter sp. AZCC_0090]MBB6405734.1 oligopeptide/dipeptide ABC transporter ATP-binding protein [Arthrobacter sp. AZCC_0090]
MKTMTNTPAQKDAERRPDPGTLLSVRDLTIEAGSKELSVRLVDHFSLDMAPGDRVALVGESGSGKSVTARAIMRLDPDFRLSGTVDFEGQDLLKLNEKQMVAVRGHKIGMVFQDPMGALNPLMTIGEQVMEPLRISGVSRAESERRAKSVLEELGVANAESRMKAYPHEFSGGMRQRVVLAMALISDPSLIIADEPTTALDVRVQEQVLTLMDKVSKERGLAVLLITHDLGTVAGFTDRVAVMYSGRKVDEASVDALFSNPAHPYTQGLLQAVPRIDQTVPRLLTIPGAPPHPLNRPTGCAFSPRCPFAFDLCLVESPELRPSPEGGVVACHLYGASGKDEGS